MKLALAALAVLASLMLCTPDPACMDMCSAEDEISLATCARICR